MNEDEKRYDVLIYQLDTRAVDSVAGSNMKLNSGSFYTAEKRAATVSPRLNDHYNVIIVEAGKFRAGDVLPKDIESF